MHFSRDPLTAVSLDSTKTICFFVALLASLVRGTHSQRNTSVAVSAHKDFYKLANFKHFRPPLPER